MTTKRAIGYCRISTKDQSNFSLEGQRDAIARHCEKHGWELVDIRTDDGQSAKNFDRIEWKQLEAYIKLHHRDIDYLVVMKYDRFSRNVSEALAMLKKLEDKYKITVISTTEHIGLHPQSPYFFQFRTQMLLNGELELRVIRDRTKFGMVSAARSGRYIGMAPFGYINTKDKERKTLLQVDEQKAVLVREVYRLYLDGVSMAKIQVLLQDKGLKVKGNSAMQRMLSNPVYTGLVHVPAYYDEPEQLTEGMHTAIIDRIMWWKVQAKLTGRDKVRIAYNEAVPLRGVVHCTCGRALTAGNSKGRTKYYWYYKCNAHPDINLKADVLHSQFDEIVKELSLPQHYIEYLQQQMVKNIETRLKHNNAAIAERSRELKQVLANIESVEEKYIGNQIDAATYRKWIVRLQDERVTGEELIAQLKAPVNNIWKRYSENLHHLMNIHYLYEKADIHQKHSLIRIVFDRGLYYSNGSYRTAGISPVFAMKAATLQAKGLLVIEQPKGNAGGIPVSSPRGSSIEPFSNTLNKIIEWAASIKAA